MRCSFVLAKKVCLLSSVRYLLEVCANLSIPVELSKLADSPVEATSEKFKVKNYFREKFRCSRIMFDGQRKV